MSIWNILGLIVGTLAGVYVALPRSRGNRVALSTSREAVNVFEGTVFPAAHDPRWRRVEARDHSGADAEARWARKGRG